MVPNPPSLLLPLCFPHHQWDHLEVLPNRSLSLTSHSTPAVPRVFYHLPISRSAPSTPPSLPPRRSRAPLSLTWTTGSSPISRALSQPPSEGLSTMRGIRLFHTDVGLGEFKNEVRFMPLCFGSLQQLPIALGMKFKIE